MTTWMLTILLCATGHPVSCTVERVERFPGRYECLQAATAARADLPPLGFGQERVRDCARVFPGPPVMPARRLG